MNVEITGTCGHTSERNLTNASGGEPGPRSLKKSIAYWSAKDCTDCYRNGKKVETANALETFGTLPDLVGSERQVAWAVRIRETQLVKIGARLVELEATRDLIVVSQPEDTATVNGVMSDYKTKADLLTTVTDAKFWIDTRDESADVLLGDKVGYDHAIKYDLDAGKVTLGQRGKQKEISYIQKRGYYKGTPRTILVGGNKFYEREVA